MEDPRNKLRIGYLTTFSNPAEPEQSTAQYRHVTQLIKLLSGNYNFIVYSIDRYNWSVDLSRYAKLVPIRSRNFIPRWLKTFFRLWRDRTKADMFIALNPTIAMLPALIMSKLFRKILVVEYGDKQITAREGQSAVSRLLQVFVETLFLRTADKWIASSAYLEQRIKKYRKDAVILLNRSVYQQPYYPESDKIELPVKIKSDYVNIAYMGGLHYNRGVDVLINAFSRLPVSEGVCLYITGAGPAKSGLEQLVEERKIRNISFIRLDDAVVHRFMCVMDILVIPHRRIGKTITDLPSKSIEYMWAGKAIIATNVGEAVNLFEHGKNAVLIEPDDENTLKEALLDLIADEKKRAILGKNARRYFDENFSKEVTREKLLNFFRKIVAAGSH